jgi:hypothetical protein
MHTAEKVEAGVGELQTAVLVGADTIRWAPLRRRSRAEFERYARTLNHTDLAVRDTRVLVRHVLHYVRSGRAPQAELADAIRDLGLAIWELPAQFHEPWRSGDVLRIALQAAGRATGAAARTPDLALNEIASQVRAVAIDIVKASEAGESDRGPLAETPTEELLADLPLTGSANATL